MNVLYIFKVITTEADEIVKEAHKIFEEVDDKVCKGSYYL